MAGLPKLYEKEKKIKTAIILINSYSLNELLIRVYFLNIFLDLLLLFLLVVLGWGWGMKRMDSLLKTQSQMEN